MPHSRYRDVLPLFINRLKLSRVVTIQGCRQSGKSFFAKRILTKELPNSHYTTFDSLSEADFAEKNPETFLHSYSKNLPLIIDEAQKVPVIFDAVKLRVDENPRPGQYVLLGSTEFNKLLKIHEALTGRMSRIRLFSLNIAEANKKKLSNSPIENLFHEKPRFTRDVVLKHLERGGFPGIFYVHSKGAFEDLLRDWIDLTVQRDLNQFPKIKVDSFLAFEVLRSLATVEEPTSSEVARVLSRDTRVIQRILNLLETLFVVHKLLPHPLGRPAAPI